MKLPKPSPGMLVTIGFTIVIGIGLSIGYLRRYFTSEQAACDKESAARGYGDGDDGRNGVG
jgi:hypothetical protein